MGSIPTPGTMILGVWTLFYATPAAVAVYIKNKQTSLEGRVFVMHLAVLLSVGLLSLASVHISWSFGVFSLSFLLLATLLALCILGNNGLLYALSSGLQEWCILLAGTLLLGGYGLAWSAPATSIVFALAHYRTRRDLGFKLPILFLWGCFSLFLYIELHDPLLNIGLHAVGGAILIHKKMLYRGE